MRDVDVFLFDEPLSNLDAKLRSELRVEIKRLHQQLENTMIYVTHDQIEALTLADRIAVMRGGYIQQLADPKTIYNKPANLFVAGFIGSPAMTMLKGKIVDTPEGRGFATDGVTVPLAGYDGGIPAAGAEVILGVRPEHVSIRTDGAGPARGDRHRRADGLGQPDLADLRRRAVSRPHHRRPRLPPRPAGARRLRHHPRLALRPEDRTAPLRPSARPPPARRTVADDGDAGHR